jgi:hypothetical protein
VSVFGNYDGEVDHGFRRVFSVVLNGGRHSPPHVPILFQQSERSELRIATHSNLPYEVVPLA